MATHVARALDTAASIVILNAPPNSAGAALARDRTWPLASDAPYDADGPLSGIKAALQWAKAHNADMVATAPCDAPLLPPDLYPRLRMEIGEAPAAYARTSAGPHPLCALWRLETLPAVEAALANGAHPSIRMFLDALGAAVVEFPDPAPFANLNTPEDAARASGGLVQPGQSS